MSTHPHTASSITKALLFTLALAPLTLMDAMAQAPTKGKLVDSRDQAEGWYLPVHGQLMFQGKPAGVCDLTLYKDNTKVASTKTNKKGRFHLELDIDQFFTLMVEREGAQPKLIYFDTALPPDLVKYPDYELWVNLQPPFSQKDEFYTDFPSAIVRYSAEQRGFYHSEHYLGHIQTRLAGNVSATF